MTIKNINIHLGYLTGAIAAFVVAFLTAQGTVQEYFQFAGVANEIAFCYTSFVLSILLLVSSFSKSSK